MLRDQIDNCITFIRFRIDSALSRRPSGHTDQSETIPYTQKTKPEMPDSHFRFFCHVFRLFRHALHFHFYDRCLPLLYPRHCPLCDALLSYGSYICVPCAAKLPYVSQPVCLACGKPVATPEQEYCYDCRIFPKSFQCGIALFVYNEKTRPAMTAFKYKNRRVLSQFFARAIYARHGEDILRLRPSLLVPVPIHKNKRRLRGYNQAELLARDLSVLLQIPCCANLLLRREDTPPQKTLRPQARLNNLQDAFAINPAFLHLTGALNSVLLIDDIYTTGATMEICTRILHAAGIQKVYIYSVCIGIARD